MDRDSDSSTEDGPSSVVSAYPAEARSDEEDIASEKEKAGVKVDPCLICAQPAVLYSTNGNPIKREILLQGDYTYQQLFSNLCYCLKISKTEDFFQHPNDAFPFCDQCEVLLVKLSELNAKLKEMEMAFRTKIIQAEGMYLKDGLYEKSDQSYFNFRKQIPDLLAFNFQKKPVQNVNVPRHILKTREASKIKVEGIVKNAKVFLRSRNVQSLPSSSLFADNYDNEEDNWDDHDHMQASEISRRSDLRVSKRRITNNSANSGLRKRRKFGKLNNIDGDGESRPLPKSSKFSKPLKKDKRHWPRRGNSITEDMATGNLTYKTGISVSGGISYTTLVFQKLIEKPPRYRCNSCLEVIPQQSTKISIQRKLFRQHFLAFHSDHIQCKLCNEPDYLQFRNKPDFMKHLKEIHKISTLRQRKHIFRYQQQMKEALKQHPECEICGMPFEKYSRRDHQKHQRSHYGEEDKAHNLELCLTCGKQFEHKISLTKHIIKFHSEKLSHPCKYPSCGEKFDKEDHLEVHVKEEHSSKNTDLKTPICIMCGKTFYNKIRCLHHLATVHSSKVTKYQCSLCSKIFLEEVELDIHMACKHNQGNGYGEFICPECSRAFPSGAHLSRHLKRVHGIPTSAKLKRSENPTISQIKSVELRRKRFKGKKPSVSKSTTNAGETTSLQNENKDFKKITGSSTQKKQKSGKKSVQRSEQMEKRTFRASACLGHSVTKDLVTGSLTYETGLGNRFGTKRHILIFEKVEGEDNLKCSSCSGIIPKETEDRKHGGYRQCTFCGVTKYGDELLSHFKTSHSLSTEESMKIQFNLEKLTSGSQTGRNEMRKSCVKVCDVCGKPFDSIRSPEYYHHRLSHLSEEEKGQDRRCRGGWWRPSITDSKIDERYVMCETCGKLISDVQSGIGMKNHLRTHLPENERKPFLCSICGQKYVTKNVLEKHMSSVHSDGKCGGSNTCKYPSCKQFFPMEKALKEHVTLEHATSHEAKGKLMCLLCGKVFTSTWARHQHRLVHSREKNHQCPVCSRMFPLKDTLLMHLAGVHSQGELYGKFKCEILECEYVFPFERRMRTHMRLKHGVFSRKNEGR